MPSLAVQHYHAERQRAARLLADAIAEAIQGQCRLNAAKVYRQLGNPHRAHMAEKAAAVWFDRAESLFDAALDAEQRATHRPVKPHV